MKLKAVKFIISIIIIILYYHSLWRWLLFIFLIIQKTIARVKS